MKHVFLLLTIVLGFAGISITSAADPPLNVVATTSIIADVAENVGGDWVSVSPLVPPGADAHAFEPTPQDALKVSQADVVLAAGAGYEAFLTGLMDNAASVPVVRVSDGVTIYPLVADEAKMVNGAIDVNVAPLGVLGVDDICGEHPTAAPEATAVPTADTSQAQITCDPHVWTDPKNGMIWADNMAVAFANADPANAGMYKANAESYKKQLQTADEEIRQTLSVIPDERRILVTNHEFMSYFARAYDFRLAGVVIPGGTTASEVDPQHLAALIQTVKDLRVPAIFAEATANTQVIDTLAEDTEVQVVSTLSESLTDAAGAAPTYLDYLRYNAKTIADALK
jgi:zinc/manganese transport system substrate-binding protein